MPFIPHTDDDVRAMLAAIGVDSIERLFDEIPAELRQTRLTGVPPGLSEMQMMRLMRERAASDGTYTSFLGAGAYEHHIPAAVWQIATRGEFYSSYTPYQAEASQGTLQLLYEYQTMMTALTALEVTNASLYDGASALAEAVLMAVRAQKGARRIITPKTLNPVWRKVVRTIVRNQKIELTEIAYDATTGAVERAALDAITTEEHAALIIPHPDYFGVLEDVDALTDWAHSKGLLVIAVVNPTSLAVLKPPGEWGEKGADIAVGEGQPLGVPLSSGGPYFGFMACREKLTRQMPGRIVGRTVDADGRTGYTLTLQAREQHIRRSKATSNICTNQGLMVAAATLYMSLVGPEGLAQVARASHANTMKLRDTLAATPGVDIAFAGAIFHEFVLKLKTPAAPVLRALKAQGILGGLDLAPHYPELGPALLVCATETKTEEDLTHYAHQLSRIVAKRLSAASATNT
jgi:glycine dehydrogenase subunit 1